MSTKNSRAKNRYENEKLHAEKVNHYGLGRRARSRLLSGKRIARTVEEHMLLVDARRDDLIDESVMLIQAERLQQKLDSSERV